MTEPRDDWPAADIRLERSESDGWWYATNTRTGEQRVATPSDLGHGKPKEDLIELVHDTLCDCKDRGYGLTLRGRELEDLADALLAAYPQLAATESVEWGLRLNQDREFVIPCDESTADHPRAVRRTVYATPWEDAS